MCVVKPRADDEIRCANTMVVILILDGELGEGGFKISNELAEVESRQTNVLT